MQQTAVVVFSFAFSTLVILSLTLSLIPERSILGPGKCVSTSQCEADDCEIKICINGVCVLTGYKEDCCSQDSQCSDGNTCTTDSCVDNVCVHSTPECSENDDCEEGEVCHNCACVPVSEVDCTSTEDCDDDIDCTIDICGYGGVCMHVKVPGCCLADGDCATGKICNNNKCVVGTGGNVTCAHSDDCDDGIVCTLDICEPDYTCNNIPLPGCCSFDTDCMAGSVQVGCNRVGSCDQSTGLCTFSMEDEFGEPCSCNVTYYLDVDGDGYGDPSTTGLTQCLAPTGYVGNGQDCDDSSYCINPAATRLCNDLDNDCSGVVESSDGTGDAFDCTDQYRSIHNSTDFPICEPNCANETTKIYSFSMSTLLQEETNTLYAIWGVVRETTENETHCHIMLARAKTNDTSSWVVQRELLWDPECIIEENTNGTLGGLKPSYYITTHGQDIWFIISTPASSNHFWIGGVFDGGEGDHMSINTLNLEVTIPTDNMYYGYHYLYQDPVGPYSNYTVMFYAASDFDPANDLGLYYTYGQLPFYYPSDWSEPALLNVGGRIRSVSYSRPCNAPNVRIASNLGSAISYTYVESGYIADSPVFETYNLTGVPTSDLGYYLHLGKTNEDFPVIAYSYTNTSAGHTASTISVLIANSTTPTVNDWRQQVVYTPSEDDNSTDVIVEFHQLKSMAVVLATKNNGEMYQYTNCDPNMVYDGWVGRKQISGMDFFSYPSAILYEDHLLLSAPRYMSEGYAQIKKHSSSP